MLYVYRIIDDYYEEVTFCRQTKVKIKTNVEQELTRYDNN